MKNIPGNTGKRWLNDQVKSYFYKVILRVL